MKQVEIRRQAHSALHDYNVVLNFPNFGGRGVRVG